jgi:hypothetical protein
MTRGSKGLAMTVTRGVDPAPALDALLSTFFSSVSFNEGERPDYDAVRALFIKRGLLIKNIAGATEVLSVDEFISPRQAMVDEGVLTSFLEKQVSATTSVFGAVAHRMSVYTKSGVQHGEEFAARGVILTQFVDTDGTWRISSMTWDDERPGLVVGDQHAEH